MLVVITVFVLFVCLSRFFTYSFADESEIWIRCNPFESLDVWRLQLFLQIFILSGNSNFFLCFTLTFMDLCREMLCVLHLRSLLRCCFNFSIMFDDLFKCYVILFEFRFGIVYFFALARVLSIITKLLSHFAWTVACICAMCPSVRLFSSLAQFRVRWINVERIQNGPNKLPRWYSMRKTLVKICLVSVFRLHPLDFS